MSARDRAFSKQDREILQEMIDEEFERVTPAMKSREERLQFIEDTISKELLRATSFVMLNMVSRLQEQQFYEAYETLSGALSVLGNLKSNPANAKRIAPELRRVIEETLASLVETGFVTWEELSRHSKDNS
jgi:beta-lactamase class A